MTDIEVEVAIAVEVGPSRRGGPVAVAAQAGAGSRILERSVATIVQKSVRLPTGDEQVGMAVVVVVADRDAVSISPRKPVQSGPLADILECSVATVPEQAVAGMADLQKGARARPERQ